MQYLHVASPEDGRLVSMVNLLPRPATLGVRGLEMPATAVDLLTGGAAELAAYRLPPPTPLLLKLR